jgi:hypothetical protein
LSRPWRCAFVLTTLAAVACGPLLGLDDLHENIVTPKDEGGTDAAADAAPPCKRNAECIKNARGSPALCVAGQCVNVNKELCLQQVLPDIATLESDNVVVAASFLPLEGPSALLTGPGLAYSLALKEIKEAGGILGTPHRDLAMIVCKSDPASVHKALDHVIKELRLPAILANFGSGDLARLIPTEVVEAGVFTLNPSVTTDALKFASTNRLVWSLLGTAEDVARAYRPVLLELQKEKLGGASLKVALVATNGSLDQPMADLLEKGQRIQSGPDAGAFDTSTALLINGDPPSNNASFMRLNIASNELSKPDPGKLAAAKTQLKDFQPDVIIALTAGELSTFVVEIDDYLVAAKADAAADAGADAGAAKTPYWILGPSNGGTIRNGQPTALGTHLSPAGPDKDKAARRARFVGVQYAGAVDTRERDDWRGRMTLVYGDAGAEGLASENFYDAVYWLAYGIAAAGPDAPLAGTSFRDGVRDLVSGPTKVFSGSPMTVQESFRVVGQLKGASFVGALGPPDINEAAGTWNSVGAVYCYPPPGPGALPTYDVRRYENLDGGQLSPEGGPINCTSN